MAFSEVQIANMALSRIGAGQRISALDEASQEARACDVHFEPMRNVVLEAFPWGFANRYASLGLVEEDPNADWDYSYRWPVKCLKPLRIVSGVRPDPDPPPFSIGHDSSGRLIFTNEETATLFYTEEVTDPQWWSASFASALAWRLASEIAFELEASRHLRDSALEMYRQALVEAEVNDLHGEQPDPLPDSSAVRARD